MNTKGQIASWNEEKGYGFIQPADGGKRVFVHVSAFMNKKRQPETHQTVTYALSKDKQGRVCAAKVAFAGERLPHRTKKQRSTFFNIVIVIFFLFLVLAVMSSKLPLLVLIVYAVVSLITFIAYASDKVAAQSGRWRTQEKTLHLLSLLGGWPGALVAQKHLRHKSQKTSFQIFFWLTVVINCGLLAWLFTPKGSSFVEAMQREVMQQVSVINDSIKK